MDTRQEKEERGSGIVTFTIPQHLADEIVIDGYEKVSRLHITLVHIPKPLDDYNKHQWFNTIQGNLIMMGNPPNKGRLIRKECFTGLPNDDEQNASVLLVDIPGIYEWREIFVTELEKDGLYVSKNNKFLPHITIAYFNKGVSNPMDDKTYNFNGNIIDFGEAVIWV